MSKKKRHRKKDRMRGQRPRPQPAIAAEPVPDAEGLFPPNTPTTPIGDEGLSPRESEVDIPPKPLPATQILDLMDKGRAERGYPRVLTPKDRAKIDTSREATIREAWQHYHDHHPVITCVVEFQLRDGMMALGLVDMQPKHYGMLVGSPLGVLTDHIPVDSDDVRQSIDQLRQASPYFDKLPPLNPNRGDTGNVFQIPKWEGTFSFAPVWQACERIFGYGVEDSAKRQSGEMGEDAYTNLGYIASRALADMRVAHVIHIDQEQVAVIPEWERFVVDPQEYAAHAKLPFESVYLDTSGPGCLPALYQPSDATSFDMYGALMWQRQEGYLSVMPIGGICIDRKREWTKYIPLGVVHFGAEPTDADKEEGLFRRETFKTGLGPDAEARVVDIRDMLRHAVADTFSSESSQVVLQVKEDDELLENAKGRVDLFLPDSIKGHHPRTASTYGFAVGLWVMAQRFLNVLFFIDTPMIEIVDAPVTRQVRRQAERKGHKISKKVIVRHKQTRYEGERNGDGAVANYSHRFEVRGHWKHFPVGTRLADAHPDQLSYVPGRGMCYKVWCPPFIKGPEELPFIPKTRVLPEDR